MDSSSSRSTNIDYFDDLSEGSGQPAHPGVIAVADSGTKFVAEDVRSKGGIVFHYGFVENSGEESEPEIRERLHSGGRLLDTYMYEKYGIG